MQSGQEVVQLHLDDIIPNRFQPREVFDERALKELAASIKEHGVIQPIIVRQVNNKYEIIAGERRYKASALAGMTKIPAIVNNLDDKEAAKVALLENLQRKNLNPIEEARTYQKILELDQMTQEQLAKTMGKSQSAVANKLRLLALPDDIQIALLKEEISERHARTLLNLSNPEDQRKMLNRIITEKMSVRNLEEEIKKINGVSTSNQEGEKNIMQNELITNNNSIKSNQSEFILNPSNNFTVVPQPATKPTLMEMAKEDKNEVINYGNIDDDELDNENKNIQQFNSQEISANQTFDIDKIKTDTKDINQIFDSQKQPTESEEKTKISNDLDSLLNIKPQTTENNGFTVVMDAIKNEEDNNKLNKEEYFQGPELMSVQLPDTTTNANAVIKNYDNPLEKFQNMDNQPVKQSQADILNMNNKSSLFQDNKPKSAPQKQEKSLGMALIEDTFNIKPKEKQKDYNTQQMVQKIRETIQLLEKSGAKIDTDEIDFENQYQIVIRIDKNN
ncbi:MAG: ParB/RepB/Spo0J family partition protein [Bacilli bacterium]|nr:ParB/RepB/Spo0J family partition protein [Bacilli bacterium]